MTRIRLGLITASAAASFMFPERHFEAVSTELPPLVSDTTAMSNGVGDLSRISNVENFAHGQLSVPEPGIAQWTQREKRRYKQLVSKFARSLLSDSEKLELETLEVARNRFEDERSPDEILSEFRSRQTYAALLTSLKNASQ
jgi:hypothetical protein